MAVALFSAVSACGQCHSRQAALHAASAMAYALENAADCAILQSHRLLQFREGQYSYTIRREADRSIYTVSDGKSTIGAPIRWAFGLGAAGQTYVFERDGRLFESRVSFYSAIDGLDLTMGAANGKPATLEEAAGRKMETQDARDCFNCHSTGAVAGSTLQLDAVVPGVQCVRCHAGGDRHAAAFRAGDPAARMPRLAALSTEEVSDFCGACHRTWEQIAVNGPRGLLNVRFQPYRLAGSKCYDAADRRIACTACHDPHGHAPSPAANYDSKCQACHASGSAVVASSSHPASAPQCRGASRNCVSCHMPKIKLPGAHFAFTDHRIRVVRAGEPYPD